MSTRIYSNIYHIQNKVHTCFKTNPIRAKAYLRFTINLSNKILNQVIQPVKVELNLKNKA